jgi:hypothetical protein
MEMMIVNMRGFAIHRRLMLMTMMTQTQMMMKTYILMPTMTQMKMMMHLM